MYFACVQMDNMATLKTSPQQKVARLLYILTKGTTLLTEPGPCGEVAVFLGVCGLRASVGRSVVTDPKEKGPPRGAWFVPVAVPATGGQGN